MTTIYCWYATKLKSFLKFNINSQDLVDNKFRYYTKISASSNENVIFKTPLQICNTVHDFTLEKYSKYRLKIRAYSSSDNIGYISLWVNSIKISNNKIIRNNLELYPYTLRKQTHQNDVPYIYYDFVTKNITNVWFGFSFKNVKCNDSFCIYKIELIKL